MREISTQEVKDPVQLARYIRELTQVIRELNQRTQQLQTAQPVVIMQSPERLPDQVLVDLQLTQVARQHNYTGMAAPTNEDNLAKGYTPGSRWYVPGTIPEIYECVEATNGTATWVQVY